MSILFCPFDGTAKITGTGFGSKMIKNAMLQFKDKGKTLSGRTLEIEGHNSAIYCRELKRVMQKHMFRLIVGGEHLITFPIVEALHERFPNLKLIILDAHHDAYRYPLSTNYSVFFHIINELKIPTLFVGLRYEKEMSFKALPYISVEEIAREGGHQAKRKIEDFVGGDPFHLSVDFDVLDPTEFRAVSSPVPKGLSIMQLEELFYFLLRMNPQACDLVEYNALKDDSQKTALSGLHNVLKRSFLWSQA